MLTILQHGDAFAETPETGQATSEIAPTFISLNAFILAPANPTHSSGAAKICEVLQAFATVMRAARENRLPLSPLEVGLCGEMFDVESPAAACIEIEKSWSERARACQLAKRDLTPEEATTLEIAGEFLEGIGACWNGDAWRDLEETDLQSRNISPIQNETNSLTHI